MLVIYLAVLITAGYWVIKTLGPEMSKPSPVKAKAPVPSKPVVISRPEDTDKRVVKLEALLSEKNKNINLLQMELKTQYVQINTFDRVKMLLYEEINHLREQNRIFRSELGLPAAQPKETSIT